MDHCNWQWLLYADMHNTSFLAVSLAMSCLVVSLIAAMQLLELHIRGCWRLPHRLLAATQQETGRMLAVFTCRAKQPVSCCPLQVDMACNGLVQFTIATFSPVLQRQRNGGPGCAAAGL